MRLNDPLNVLAVVGSLNRTSSTRAVVLAAAQQLKAAGVAVDVLDLLDEPLALPNGTMKPGPGYSPLL